MTKTQTIIICSIFFVFGFFSSCVFTRDRKEKSDPVDTPLTLKLKKDLDSIFKSIESDKKDIQRLDQNQINILDSLKQNSKSGNEEKKKIRNFTPSSKSRWIDSLERANSLK